MGAMRTTTFVLGFEAIEGGKRARSGGRNEAIVRI